jgi:Tfp pilus assembly protein PilX
MWKLYEKLKKPVYLLKSQRGFSILAMIFVMLVLSAIGYSLAKTMAIKQKTVPVTIQSSNAFYLAESGINYTGKYLSDLVTWPPSGETKNIGNGSFTIAYSDYCAYGSCPEGGTNMCVTVQSTGTSGDGERVLTSRLCREQGFGCVP